MGKMDVSFYEAVAEIARKRFNDRKDKFYSPPTVQKKILKHNAWPQIKKDLEIAEFIKDENAQLQYSTIFSPFRFIIVIFMAVIFFAGLIYITGLLNNAFIDVGRTNEGNAGMPGYTNLSYAASITFGKMNESIGGLRLVAITLIFSEILLIFVINAFTKIHPLFFMVWIFIVFLAVIFAAPIANSYEALLQARIFDGTLESFTGANWILLNLPVVTLLVGVLGGIFMFINILRAGGEQGLT